MHSTGQSAPAGPLRVVAVSSFLMADAGGVRTNGDDVEDSVALAESRAGWADWNTAKFTPLEELDPGLADELTLSWQARFLLTPG